LATPDQVAAQIRFALENLSASNAHHKFEDICRYLARARICNNILPATGPVSTAGDQGRDFETYRTYLAQARMLSIPFLGIFAAKPIVFACSLEKDVVGKIGDDVKKILGHGERPDAIYFFTTSDVPIGIRHKVQTEVYDDYHVKLEIMDGKAISEELAEPELFWIAERYLSVPEEIYPTKREEDWYAKAFSRWRSGESRSINYATFAELRQCARHAAYSDSLKADASFWIGHLQAFKVADIPEDLKRKVIYELAFVSLHGLGHLSGLEADLRRYFQKISELYDPVQLADSTALLTLCIAAVASNSVQVGYEEVRTWHSNLVETVENLLDEKPSPGLACVLLEVRGHLALVIDLKKGTVPAADEALKWWGRMTEIVPKAPLYPIMRFSDRLTRFIEFLDITPDYVNLSRRVDDLLENRYGGFVAAEKCRDRAMKFFDRGSILAALEQMHIAKVNWFAEETLRGCLLSMVFIAHCYEKLGLTFASKYYLLAVAHIAINSANADLKPFVPKALFLAAECDYHAGSWINFLDLAPVALNAHYAYASDPDNLEKNSEFKGFIFNLVTIQVIAERLYPQLSDFVIGKIQRLNLGGLISDFIPLSRKSWESKSDKDIWEICQNDLLHIPFGDAGKTRSTSWIASGIECFLAWTNDYTTNSIAEQLAALLQIIMADLATTDLCLLPTTVSIAVETLPGPKVRMKAIPSNKGRQWQISMPSASDKTADIEALQQETVAHATVILGEISLLPFEKYRDLLELKFKNGLSAKVFVGGPYDRLYSEFITRDTFNRNGDRARIISKPLYSFGKTAVHNELRWKEGPGPTYESRQALELIRTRYANSVRPIRRTLHQLASEQGFLKVVRKLRNEGWRDWHILSSLANVATNYRTRILSPSDDSAQYNEIFLKLIVEEETDDSLPVPLAEYTEESIRLAHKFFMISTLHAVGLDCRQETPDFQAIERFLAERYNYWTDDAEHVDPFPQAH
jgi:hypothetical protein